MITADAAELGFSPDRLNEMSKFFDGYVERGNFVGMHTVVARKGEIVYSHMAGHRDQEADAPVAEDTIWRIYSMTKPITTVLLMALYEQGLLQLSDPLSKFIPAFADTRVFARGNATSYHTDFPAREITIHDLLTHTSGLTYGLFGDSPVAEMYASRDIGTLTPKGLLEDVCNELAGLPLIFSPGERWSYSIATDVIGRVIEVITGQSLDVAMQERVLGPLGMTDTAFQVPEASIERFSACYFALPDGKTMPIDAPSTSPFSRPPDTISGGGGLLSTAGDYFRFCQMMLNGGELNGTRILGRKTVEFMTRNHLPGGADLEKMGQAVFSETTYAGIGFGLGFAVVLDPSAAQVMANVGEYSWGGAASTAFYIDPSEDVIAMQFAQLIPSGSFPVRSELRTLINAALA